MDARAKAKVRVRKSIAKMEIVAMKGFENLGLGIVANIHNLLQRFYMALH